MSDRVALPGSVHQLEVLPVVGPPDKDLIGVTVVPAPDSAVYATAAALFDLATAHRLEIVSEDDGGYRIEGTPGQVARAFSVDLELVDHPKLGRFRRQNNAVKLPRALDGHVVAVLGLDDRPIARPYLHPIPRAAARSFTPPQLASLYGFPTATGKGQRIGVIELGGAFSGKDLSAYLSGLGVKGTGTVTVVPVDGATPVSDGPDGADGEVMLDVEIIASLAPDADVRMYFGPNTDAGFLDAFNQAVTDGCKVISISWGGPEDAWTPSSRTAFDQAFAAAAAKGVTVLCAAGDQGSSDGERGAHVDFPAASPNVTACGGTTLKAGGTRQTISSEVVWDDNAKTSATGGGYSKAFPTPVYQQHLLPSASTGRGVPDVAGNADPVTGYQVRVDGQDLVYGGTSAVAPLWAGLIARVNELNGQPVGFLNPALYKAGPLRDITNGSNGSYTAGEGWDPCTGLGSPDGAKVLAAVGTPAIPPILPPATDTVDRAAVLAILDQARAQLAALPSS